MKVEVAARATTRSSFLKVATGASTSVRRNRHLFLGFGVNGLLVRNFFGFHAGFEAATEEELWQRGWISHTKPGILLSLAQEFRESRRFPLGSVIECVHQLIYGLGSSPMGLQ